MTPNLHIICVEDESAVLDAVLRDLRPFEDTFRLSGAGDAAEAREIIDGLDAETDRVALIFCDHIMPGERGVDLLIDLHASENPVLAHTRKVLFTGQAGHDDTITAINRAGLNHYVEKPWEAAALVALTKKLLTDYVLAAHLPVMGFMAVLETERLAEALHDDETLS